MSSKSDRSKETYFDRVLRESKGAESPKKPEALGVPKRGGLSPLHQLTYWAEVEEALTHISELRPLQVVVWRFPETEVAKYHIKNFPLAARRLINKRAAELGLSRQLGPRRWNHDFDLMCYKDGDVYKVGFRGRSQIA